ncbi:hypothetical protein [Runella sp.]|uniref:hypothetical protein n=1 Tax=Runella sp. TaxID=1960881 RepID=UPI003D0AB4D8
MKNFKDLPNDLKNQLYREYNDGLITFESIEILYGIHAESFRDFLLESLNQKFLEFKKDFPSAQTSVSAWENTEENHLIALLPPIILIILTLTFALKFISTEFSVLYLSINLIRSACIAAFSVMIFDWFLAWKDPELFGSIKPGKYTWSNLPVVRQPLQISVVRLLLYSLGLTFSLLFLEL